MAEQPTVIRALTDYAAGILRHAWYILLFRHRGQGLAAGDRHLLGLAVLAALLAFATAAITPSENISHNPAVIGCFAIATTAAFYSFFGRVTAMGFIVLTLATEPLALAVRSGGLQSMDTLLSMWVLGAQFVYMARTAGLQAKTK